MNDTRKTVKTAFAFALVLAVVVGTLFGVFPEVPDPVFDETESVENAETVVEGETTVTTDAPAEAVKPETPTEDTTVVDTPAVDEPTVETPAEDEPIVETPVTDVTDVETPVEDDSTEDVGVTNDATQDSTPVDAENEIVDDSADASVAEPTDDETTATEGDVENA